MHNNYRRASIIRYLDAEQLSISHSAFERMEAKFMQSEASSQADGELVDIDPLEAGSDVDDELALLKA
ncbi:MAG: PspA/IM30 family protein, partial [Dolichospermum sp.]